MIVDYVCQDISNVLCQQQAVLDLKTTDFWDVTVPHLQVERLKFYVSLKMQATGLSLILVGFRWTVYCSVTLTPLRADSVSAVQILRSVSHFCAFPN